MIVSISLLLINLLIIIFEFSHKSIAILLWSVLLVLFTIPHFIIYYLGIYSKSTLNEAGLFVCFFNLFYLMTRIILNYAFRTKYKEKIINYEKITKEKKRNVNTYTILYLIVFSVLLIDLISKGYSIFTLTWTEARIYNKGFIPKIIKYFLTAFGGVGFINFLRKERSKFIIVFFIYLFYVLITKSRFDIIPFIIPFLIYYLFSGNTKKILKSIFLGFVTLFSIFLLQQIRYAGSIITLFNNHSVSEIVKNAFSYLINLKGEFELSRVFYYFVENDNNFKNFGEGRTYIRLILLLFPGSIFHFKYRDFAMDMWEAWWRIPTYEGTMHPTLYGDVYANFGFIGVFMGIFYAVLVKFNDYLINNTKIESKRVFYISIIGTMYVVLARGAVYNSIANAFWSIILINIISNTIMRIKVR